MYKKAQKLKLIVDGMRNGQSLYSAIQSAGVRSHATIINWRRQNPRIDKLLKRADELCSGKRDGMVVDSLFKQAVSGNPTCIAIYLKFKMGWKDNPMFVNEINNANVTVTGKEKERQDALVSRLDKLLKD